jgi:hypothetical protein
MKEPLPELIISPSLRRRIDALASSFASVEDAERAAIATNIAKPLCGHKDWIDLCEIVSSSIRGRGYIVVRGLEADEGRSMLVLGTSLGATFHAYSPGRIVKRFRMSPWTEELSHTIRAGDFHTDGNVSEIPPTGTAMQCEREDPGAPEYAEQRVAYLPDLLSRLAAGTREDDAALTFLTKSNAALAHERSADVWRGHLVQNGMVRYHPNSLRIASRRLAEESGIIDSVIAAVHRAAMDISVPFHTRAGDTVLVSNRTALHYRGACSVRFINFPLEFDSRSLFVLHVKDEIA